MRTRPPIPEKELEAIRRSVTVAVRRSITARSAEGRRENRLRSQRGYTIEHYEADALIEKLVFAPRPLLNEPDVMRTVCAAAKRNHTRFFIRLGKTLARKPKPQSKEFSYRLPPMQTQFLIAHWVDTDSRNPYGDLCRLTADGLLAVLQHKFGRQNVNVDVYGIDKQRLRLGLRYLPRPKVHVIFVGNRLKFLN